MTRRLCALAAIALGACGGAQEAAPVAIARAEPARDTAQIAEQIAGGRVGALLYMERLRKSPLADKLDVAFRWRTLWADTGLDLQRDVDRVFATSPGLDRPDRAVWVASMNAPLDRVEAAVDVLFKKERVKGEWIEGRKRREAHIELRDGVRRLVFIPPNWVAIVPEDQADEAERFGPSGGFPDPIGAEALLLFAFAPSKTLHGKYGSLDVPESIRVGVAEIAFTVDGGLELGVDALSANESDAKHDAEELTQKLDDATSIRVSSLRVHFVDPIVFHADGAHVRGRRTVPASEIDGILAFARPKPAASASASPSASASAIPPPASPH